MKKLSAWRIRQQQLEQRARNRGFLTPPGLVKSETELNGVRAARAERRNLMFGRKPKGNTKPHERAVIRAIRASRRKVAA